MDTRKREGKMKDEGRLIAAADKNHSLHDWTHTARFSGDYEFRAVLFRNPSFLET